MVCCEDMGKFLSARRVDSPNPDPYIRDLQADLDVGGINMTPSKALSLKLKQCPWCGAQVDSEQLLAWKDKPAHAAADIATQSGSAADASSEEVGSAPKTKKAGPFGFDGGGGPGF